MNVTADEVRLRLSREWPGVRVGQPEPLPGGYWATMFRVPVAGQPDEVSSEVVVRFAPHRRGGAKEAEVQRALAGMGFSTPSVWVSAPLEVRDGWWSVSDFSPGVPLLAGLDGAAVLRRAPSVLRRLPLQLAEAAGALHRCDPGPVTAAVSAAAPGVPWSVAELVEGFRRDAVTLDRPDLAAALERLADELPDAGGEVLCHGDLHPFNILDREGRMVVLDWTNAVLAHPCFDLAFTRLLLANPPFDVPNVMRPVVRLAGRSMARRFVTAYRRANPHVGFDRADWFHALHCTRVLLETAGLRAAHGPGGGDHPFFSIAPIAAGALSDATGVEISEAGPRR